MQRTHIKICKNDKQQVKTAKKQFATHRKQLKTLNNNRNLKKKQKQNKKT